MDWDQSEISYAAQFQERKSDSTDVSTIQKQFRQFLREFRLANNAETFLYRKNLHSSYSAKDYKLVVDFQHLLSFDETLCEQFREHPAQYLPLFEAAALEVIAMSKTPKPMKEDMHPVQIQIVNLSITQIPVRKLHTSHIAKLVRIPGIIISSTKPSAKATQVTFQCRNCKAIIKRAGSRGFGSIPVPRTCENSSDEKNDKACPIDPFTILADRCKFMDIQRLKLQESPEDIPTGEIPRHITLFCERRLVNRVKCGTRVNITGIYKLFEHQSKNKRSRIKNASVRKPYIEVVGIEEDNQAIKCGIFSLEEEEKIRDMARNPNIIGIIAQSIAPAIWGNADIKKAIACLLFGGSQKILADRMRLRGDINVLLLGDPSVAKSQFLKFVKDVAPIAVYTSGKGSSAAGLTASVIRDAHSGEFHLEAGAMVLADGGVVCIDEFDKMRDTDRVAIHEAMEQQTISIAKAGITTILNSRTSVLAAANPTFGRYDDFRTTSENIDFEATILSRFDLIFIIRDRKDRKRDKKLAKHIMDLHININKNRSASKDGNGIEPDMLSKYIAYARHRKHPRLTTAAAQLLKTKYVQFRREHKRQTQLNGRSSGIPLTVRQLESLIRISESLAKMELKDEATVDHVKEAVRLFKISTIKAAKGSSFGGEFSNPAVMETVKRCERILKRRVTVGSTVNYEKLMGEMGRRGIARAVVRRTVHIMMGRGEIVLRKGRSQIYRVV